MNFGIGDIGGKDCHNVKRFFSLSYHEGNKKSSAEALLFLMHSSSWD